MTSEGVGQDWQMEYGQDLRILKYVGRMGKIIANILKINSVISKKLTPFKMLADR